MKKISRLINTSILAICSFSTANATVLINEIDYDQEGTDTAEFIELFNSGSSTANLDSYRLDLINGTSTTEPPAVKHSFDLTGYSLTAGSYFVICGNASMVINCDIDTGISRNMIQNGSADGIALYNGSDLIDAVTYEGVITDITEGSQGTLADTGSGIFSIGRLLGSQDTNDNAADFERGCITPGSANISGTGDCSALAAATGAVSLPSIMWLFGSGLIGIAASLKEKETL